MIKRFLIEPQGPTTYLLALLLVVLIAIGAGLWAGAMTASYGLRSTPGVAPAAQRAQRPSPATEVPLNDAAPPLMLMASPDTPEEWSDYHGEIAMAAAQGIHRFVVPLPLAWREPWDSAPLIAQLEAIVALDPMALFVLDLNLNPTPEWLRTHPESVVTVNGQASAFASPFSPAWKNAGVQEAAYLISALRESPLWRRVRGFILSAMHEGSWRFVEGGYDTSLSSEAAFERWLATRYGSLEAVPAAWKADALPRPLTPPYPDVQDTSNVFFKRPEENRQVDYLRFLSESTAEVLARIASELRERTGEEIELLARYGFSLELEHNAAGQFALQQLEYSELDGFISPLSYASRGSGATGGPMAPIHSAVAHGKRWYLLDDTRTGVARDPLTGAISRIEGLRAEDVYTVQERNFSMAVTQGMGIIWSDPHAQGWLHDVGQWEKFRQFADLYCETHPEFSMSLEKADADGSKEEEGESTTEGASEGMTSSSLDRVTLQVVVDEGSRHLVRSDAPLHNALLLQGRDAALMAGVPCTFVLLDDFIDERTPEAAVYLFLNTFELTIEERERLQARFAAEQAAVIWQYTPGYFRDAPRTDHITSTTRITVEPFSKPERAGSRMTINGRWIRQNDTFGYRGVLSPLFYINDNDSDVIAVFEGSNKPSVAIKTLDTGWTSVLVTDAMLSPQLLRELLHILEQQIYFRTTNGRYVDTTYFGHGLMGIHARQVGERAIDLGRYVNVTDLLDPSVGWPERDNFLLQLNHGETRLLKLQELE